MIEHNFENEPLQLIKEDRISPSQEFFTNDLAQTINKYAYRTIAAPELEGREVVKNIVQACLLNESDERTPKIFEIIDHETDEYRSDFFEEKAGKRTKNVAAVELLFELTHDFESTPLLAQAIEIRKGVPKQANVVEAEHIIRLLVLHELKNLPDDQQTPRQ